MSGNIAAVKIRPQNAAPHTYRTVKRFAVLGKAIAVLDEYNGTIMTNSPHNATKLNLTERIAEDDYVAILQTKACVCLFTKTCFVQLTKFNEQQRVNFSGRYLMAASSDSTNFAACWYDVETHTTSLAVYRLGNSSCFMEVVAEPLHQFEIDVGFENIQTVNANCFNKHNKIVLGTEQALRIYQLEAHPANQPDQLDQPDQLNNWTTKIRSGCNVVAAAITPQNTILFVCKLDNADQASINPRKLAKLKSISRFRTETDMNGFALRCVYQDDDLGMPVEFDNTLQHITNLLCRDNDVWFVTNNFFLKAKTSTIMEVFVENFKNIYNKMPELTDPTGKAVQTDQTDQTGQAGQNGKAVQTGQAELSAKFYLVDSGKKSSIENLAVQITDWLRYDLPSLYNNRIEMLDLDEMVVRSHHHSFPVQPKPSETRHDFVGLLRLDDQCLAAFFKQCFYKLTRKGNKMVCTKHEFTGRMMLGIARADRVVAVTWLVGHTTKMCVYQTTVKTCFSKVLQSCLAETELELQLEGITAMEMQQITKKQFFIAVATNASIRLFSFEQYDLVIELQVKYAVDHCTSLGMVIHENNFLTLATTASGLFYTVNSDESRKCVLYSNVSQLVAHKADRMKKQVVLKVMSHANNMWIVVKNGCAKLSPAGLAAMCGLHELQQARQPNSVLPNPPIQKTNSPIQKTNSPEQKPDSPSSAQRTAHSAQSTDPIMPSLASQAGRVYHIKGQILDYLL